jgi:DNA-binding NtrC family response regulator
MASELGASPNTISYTQLTRWEDAVWPGNVRELRNAVARLVALGDAAAPTRADPIDPHCPAFKDLFHLPIGVARERLIAAFEREYVAQVLERHGGDIESAAAASGIARRQFFRLKAKAGH